MIIWYFLVGALLAFIAGIAPGASNLAVVARSQSLSIKAGMRVAAGAGLGEVFLALFGLCYSMTLLHFLEMNLWAKLLPGILFTIIGIAVILKIKKPAAFKLKKKESSLKQSNDYLVGGLLALINPPVLLFWIIAITVIEMQWFPLNDMIALPALILFLIGVFAGKWLVLYGYARFTQKLNTNRPERTKKRPVMGYALVAIGLLQVVRNFF